MMTLWIKRTLVAFAIVTALAGCSRDAGPNERGGVVLGAILGGLAGVAFGGSGTERVFWTVAGAAGGALIGGWIGSSLDEEDQQRHYEARREATHTPVGQPVSWSNPDSGNSGRVTPVAETRNSEGEYCREFTETIEVDGETRQGSGLACRQPDGTWVIQDRAS